MDESSIRDKLFSNQLKVLRGNFDTIGDTSYLTIFLDNLMAEEKISFALYVKVRAHGQQEAWFLPLMAAEEVLELSWVGMLKKLGIDRLYFQRKDLDAVIAYLNNRLLLLDINQENQVKEKLLVLVEHLNLTLLRAFNSPHLGRHVRLAQIQVERLVGILQRDTTALKLVWKLLFKDYTLSTI